MKTVLFLCVYNASRSIMAEAILNHVGAGRFRACSAGERAIGAVHPLTLRVLAGEGIPTEGLASKNWALFFGLGAPRLDYLITVCDDSREDMSIEDPSAPIKAHWPTPNPLTDGRSEVEIEQALRDTYRLLRDRIDALVALPLEDLDRQASHAALMQIGRAAPRR